MYDSVQDMWVKIVTSAYNLERAFKEITANQAPGACNSPGGAYIRRITTRFLIHIYTVYLLNVLMLIFLTPCPYYSYTAS